MSVTKFLAFDVESGGLKPSKADLLTAYFAILDEDFKILEELSLQLKPNDGGIPIVEAGAMAVNGIDLEKHLLDPNTVTYLEGSKQLVSLIKRHLKKRGRYSNIIATGYNVNFDIKWAQHYLIDEDTWDSMVHYKYLDVMQHVDMLKYHGWLPPTVGKLSSVVEFFGVPLGTAHQAKDDILMTIGVLKKIHDFMESKKNGGNTSDLISLLETE
jgi:DNA polymerase III epsilon subunit-like protein